jgi:hypothetical protein
MSELLAVMWAGVRTYRVEPKFPDPLTDDELRRIDAPVLDDRPAPAAESPPGHLTTQPLLWPLCGNALARALAIILARASYPAEV